MAWAVGEEAFQVLYPSSVKEPNFLQKCLHAHAQSCVPSTAGLEDRAEVEFMLVTPASVQFSHSVVSDSMRPHESQHARPPCPSPSPGIHSNPCPSNRWCHPAISSSIVPCPPTPNPSQHQSLFQGVNTPAYNLGKGEPDNSLPGPATFSPITSGRVRMPRAEGGQYCLSPDGPEAPGEGVRQ